MKYIKYLIIAVATVALAACDAWEEAKNLESSDRNRNLYELLSANPDLSTFVKVLDATGYAGKLSEDMNYTVFAPDNSVLAGLDLTHTDTLTQWVQNYISEEIAYTNAEGAFNIGSILMLNGKYMSINNNLVSGVPVGKWNIASKNGVLHIIEGIIEERMNIWQYLQTLESNTVVDFIRSFEEQIMDMERSVQTGLNSDGKPVYDTIWTYRNTLLDASPLANESATATFLLLDESALEALKTKYAKYFAQKDSALMARDIMKEITTDMILQYTKVDADDSYLNYAGVMVDVNAGDITESYTASNGIVYKVNAAKVRMYQNKIKPLTIEGENYVATGPVPNAWEVRPRSWASGGRDVALKSRTRHSYDWYEPSTYPDTLTNVAGNDSIVQRDTLILHKENRMYTLSYRSESAAGFGPNNYGEPNSYISYKPRMYSTSYKIFWKAYDDNHTINHIDSRGVPMLFYQKMYISFPGEKELERNPSNVIVNNFSSYTIMAASMNAGENIETPLVRYVADNSHTVYANSFVLIQPYTVEDNYGKEDILNCPYFGQATLFVSNTCIGEFMHDDGTSQAYLQASKTANAPGMIFLDYIRLEPYVDPND
jgi:uncharacterized surface protein with fasciclin (FAS1) repeats